MEHKLIQIVNNGRVEAVVPHPLAPKTMYSKNDTRRERRIIKKWSIVDARFAHIDGFSYEWYTLVNKQGHKKVVHKKVYWPL